MPERDSMSARRARACSQSQRFLVATMARLSFLRSSSKDIAPGDRSEPPWKAAAVPGAVREPPQRPRPRVDAVVIGLPPDHCMPAGRLPRSGQSTPWRWRMTSPAHWSLRCCTRWTGRRTGAAAGRMFVGSPPPLRAQRTSQYSNPLSPSYREPGMHSALLFVRPAASSEDQARVSLSASACACQA